MRTITASAAGAAGVTAAAVLVPLTLVSGPSQRVAGPATSHSAPVALATPLHLRQVRTVSNPPCRPGTGGVLSTPSRHCCHLTETGMTVRSVGSIVLRRQRAADLYELDIRFIPADVHQWAVITHRLAGQPEPRCEIAMIVNDRVYVAATVQGTIANGNAQITGMNRARAEHLLKVLEGH